MSPTTMGDRLSANRSKPPDPNRAYRMAVVGVAHRSSLPSTLARAAGKSETNALGHCLGKALSLVWGVWPQRSGLRPLLGCQNLTRP